MKYINQLTISLVISYLVLMFFRAPQLSDAIIILSLVGLSLANRYIEYMQSKEKPIDPEILELDKKLTIEQYNLRIRDVHTEAQKRSLSKIGGNREETIW